MANREDLQEKFRQLIVPLMHMSLHDNPTDVTMYCSRYFQALLDERQRSSISGNENENIQQSKFIDTGERAERREPVPQVQESTSLPILTDVHRDRLSIRETSSWSSPSDSSSIPRRFWHLSYDVADAMSNIGDQPNSGTALEGGPDAENSNEKGPGSELFCGDEGSETRKKDPENHETNTESSPMTPSESSLINDYVASSFGNESEEVLSAIVNLVSSSADVKSQSTFRKKWSTNVDSKIHLELESEYPEDKDDEEVTMNVNCPKDETVKTLGSTSPNASFGSIPQLKELASLANVKESSSPLIQKEIENSVKSLSQYLQELIKVLDTMKSFCNENLQKVKMLSEILPAKPQAAPRKKRSVTTFSSSDNLFQSEEFLRGSGNEPTSSGTDKGCSKMSQKFLVSKTNDYVVELDSIGYDHPLKGKRIKDKPIEGNNAGVSNSLSSKKRSYADKNMERKDVNIKEVKGIDLKHKSRSNEGIVNKGFVKDDDELHRKKHGHGQLQHHGQNSWHANGYRRIILDEPHAFSQIRNSRPCSRRIGNLTRHHSQINRQMSRFRPGSGFPNIGEGGDVFGVSQRQCSVATETEPTQTTDRPGSFDARIRAIQINPFVDGNTEQEASALKNVNGKISRQVSEKELHKCNSSLSHDQSSKLSEDLPVQSGSSKGKTTAVMDKKEDAQEIKIDIKLTKKSSSLNPCAESFNPTSKLVQDLGALKSSGENEAIKSEERSSSSVNIPAEQSIISFPEIDADELWDYDMFENDFLQQDQEPILYQVDESEEHAISLALEEIEDQPNFRSEGCTTESNLLDPISCPYKENGVLHGHGVLDSGSRSEKNSDAKKREDSKKRQSDTKLAEGDQNVEAAKERAGRSDSAEKQEEPGLSSACGDFVASENNHDGEENSGDNSGNVQVMDAPGSIAFDMVIPGLPPLIENSNALQSRRREEEEMELNFACFSESDSSEVDSSDISEEENVSSAENDMNEFSGESDEAKLEERA